MQQNATCVTAAPRSPGLTRSASASSAHAAVSNRADTCATRSAAAFDLNCASQLFARIFVPEDAIQGDRGVENPYGEIYPRAIRMAVERVAPLGKPIYILENGVPDASDRIRPWLLMSVVRELHFLVAENYDIRGYFHWTLTDNFEWSEGWRLRFGLFSLDPATQERTPRRSAELYRRIIQQNGLSPELADEYGSLLTSKS